MPQAFVEYREVDVSEPIRQGDVLEAVDPAAPKWRRTLFVLTADCDLAHEKNRGRLTCIPLLDQEDYLLELALPRLRDKVRSKAVKELQEVLHANGVSNISDDRLVEWVAEESTASIAAAIGAPAAEVDAVTRSIDAVRLVDVAGQTVRECVTALVEAQTLAKRPPKDPRKQVVDALREAFRNPPGDSLFLSSISRGRHDGYFAYLRHVEQVLQPTVATAPTRRNMEYRRIARLKDRFAHALVQRFALVFLSIGLPPEYEEVRNFHADLVGEE